MLGKDQPVILQLLELTPALKPLEGVSMELNDCAFPLLRGIVQTDNPKKAFEGADYALLVGARPRSKGERHAVCSFNKSRIRNGARRLVEGQCGDLQGSRKRF